MPCKTWVSTINSDSGSGLTQEQNSQQEPGLTWELYRGEKIRREIRSSNFTKLFNIGAQTLLES